MDWNEFSDMKKCCECKKIVWPWQQSKISFSPIHLKCHQKILKASITTPECQLMYGKELLEFEIKTGIKSLLKIE